MALVVVLVGGADDVVVCGCDDYGGIDDILEEVVVLIEMTVDQQIAGKAHQKMSGKMSLFIRE